MHVLFLLAEKLRGDAVQAVRAQLVVAEHVGQHVKHDTPVDTCFHVFTFTVRAALKSCIPENRAAIKYVRVEKGYCMSEAWFEAACEKELRCHRLIKPRPPPSLHRHLQLHAIIEPQRAHVQSVAYEDNTKLTSSSPSFLADAPTRRTFRAFCSYATEPSLC